MSDKPAVLLALSREQFEVILECCRDKAINLSQLVGLDMVLAYSQDRGKWGDKTLILNQVTDKLAEIQREYFSEN